MSKIALNISLVREGATIESILRDQNTPSREIENVGVLYYKESFKKRAHKITDFFGDRLPEAEAELLYTAYVQAVLIVERYIDDVRQIFLVTFGMGKNLINKECIKDKFGMYVVLNTISPETIRSVDVNVLESIPMHDRIQSTKLSRLESFDLDSERDLLREITGQTQEKYAAKLGTTVTGADSLKILVDIDINELPERLEYIYRMSNETFYRENYDFIDNILPEKDVALTDALTSKVIENLNNRQIESVWLSIPELVDWKEVESVRYSPKGKKYYDMDINTVMHEVFHDDTVDKNKLKSRYVHAVNFADVNFDKWSLFHCLCAEMNEDGKQYVLFNGQWYLVKEKFASDVNDFYNSMDITGWQLEDAKQNEVEGKYNERICLDRDDRLLMDKKFIYLSEGRNKVELCDIYTTSKELIHVKRYSSSATLSHLFNQGLVSGELLLQKDFRELVNAKLIEMSDSDPHRLDEWQVGVQEFRREDYKIIYAIISEADGSTPSMPFFSKVALRNVCTRLRNYGYQVYLMKIGINSEESIEETV